MDRLEAEDRAKLFEQFGQFYQPGSAIFRSGDAANRCYLIHQGRVRLVKRVRSAERNLTVLRPGDLFGEEALLPGAIRTASALALTEVSALELTDETFAELVDSNPEAARKFVRQLVVRLQDSEEQIENLMLRDGPSRIVNTLLRLVRNPGEDSFRYALDISPLELASRVGLDVSEVKRIIQQLRDGNYLQIADEQLEILDLEALKKLFDLLSLKEEVRET